MITLESYRRLTQKCLSGPFQFNLWCASTSLCGRQSVQTKYELFWSTKLRNFGVDGIHVPFPHMSLSLKSEISATKWIWAVVECLESSQLVLKVLGLQQSLCGRFEKSFSSPSRKWPPDSHQNWRRWKTARKRSGAPPQFQHFRLKLALYHSIPDGHWLRNSLYCWPILPNPCRSFRVSISKTHKSALVPTTPFGKDAISWFRVKKASSKDVCEVSHPLVSLK